MGAGIGIGCNCPDISDLTECLKYRLLCSGTGLSCIPGVFSNLWLVMYFGFVGRWRWNIWW